MKVNEGGVLKSKHYFSLKDAVDDVSLAPDAKVKFRAGAKLVGKSLFNASLFTGKLAVEFAKELPGALANQSQSTLDKRSDLTPDQKARHEKTVANGRKFEGHLKKKKS